MNKKETDLTILGKAKELIEGGGFTRAQKLISGYIESHGTERCLTLKALNALCFYQLGNHTDALQHAEALLEQHKDDFDELLPMEIVAFICRTLGCQKSDSIESLAAMYDSGWRSTTSAFIGDKYAVTQALLGRFVEFQHASMLLFKTTKSVKHQLWSIFGNCLTVGNESLRFLGMKMLWRLLSQGSARDREFSSEQAHNLLRFYVSNSLRRIAAQDLPKAYDELVRDLVDFCEVKPENGAASNATPLFSMGWTISVLLDAYISVLDTRCLTSHDPTWETPAMLCVCLLRSNYLCEEVFECASINPRINFKYFKLLLDGNQTLGLRDVSQHILQVINRYLTQRQASCIDCFPEPEQTCNAISLIDESVLVDAKTHGLWRVHCALLSGIQEKVWKPLVDSIVAYCEHHAKSNLWGCFLNIRPVIIEMARKLFQHSETPNGCAVLLELLDALADMPDICLHVLLVLDKCCPSSSDSIEISTRIDRLTSLLLRGPKRTNCAEYAVTQALVHRNEPLSALAFLEFSTSAGSISEMVAVFIASRVGVLDADSHLQNICLNSIQLDTVGFLYFDALIERYYPEQLAKTCAASHDFYRSALGADALHLTESALEHFNLEMVQREIPAVQSKLALSFHRVESFVWRIIARMEEMSVDDALNHLHKPENAYCIREAHRILTTQSGQICLNEDRTILGDSVDGWCPGRALAERIDDLGEMTTFVYSLLTPTGKEWDLIDCFELSQFASADKLSSFDKIDGLSIRKFCFPGIRLLQCALRRQSLRDSTGLVEQCAELRKATDFAMQYFKNELVQHEENRTDIKKGNLCDAKFGGNKPTIFANGVVPDPAEAAEYYHDIRTRELYRWKSVLDKRLAEILTFAETLRS